MTCAWWFQLCVLSVAFTALATLKPQTVAPGAAAAAAAQPVRNLFVVPFPNFSVTLLCFIIFLQVHI